ncbi:MAG: HU family DNA-binding protein [Buchnera aphidicola (Schlechtendalia peitan)]
MNKTQLINVISKQTNLSKTKIKFILETTLMTIIDSLKNGKSVQLAGFGTFKVNKRAARIGRNPKTGEKMHISETKIPMFTSGKTFKSEIKNKI